MMESAAWAARKGSMYAKAMADVVAGVEGMKGAKTASDGGRRWCEK